MSRGGPAWWALFEAASGRWLRRRVRVHVTGVPSEGILDERPVLLCANHESFWDGFLMREAQRRVRPEGPFRTVMLASELHRRPWLEALGAIGLDPGSFGSTRALLWQLGILAERRPSSVVAFFPQGRIRPDDPRPLGFHRGISAVAAALAPAVVLPVGLRLLPGKTARMEAFLSIGRPITVDSGQGLSSERAESAVTEELDAIRAFVAEHGEDAPSRWPEEASSLPRVPYATRPGARPEPLISRN